MNILKSLSRTGFIASWALVLVGAVNMASAQTAAPTHPIPAELIECLRNSGVEITAGENGSIHLRKVGAASDGTAADEEGAGSKGAHEPRPTMSPTPRRAEIPAKKLPENCLSEQ